MHSTTAPPLQEHLQLFSQIVARVARARLSRDEAQDFAQAAHLRLIEKDYEVFRQFSGRSSLATYLNIVVTRMLHDWRDHWHGKWRPSAAARRLGPHAVLLERLIYRDGHPIDEAVTMAASRPGGLPPSELHVLAGRLPPRYRRRMVPSERLDELTMSQFEDPIEMSERRRDASRLKEALLQELAQLPAEDRRLIHARFQEGQRVKAMAEQLVTDPKKLYRRLDRILCSLRRSMILKGVAPAQARGA